MNEELIYVFLLVGLVLGFLFGFFIFRRKLRRMEIQAKEDFLTKIANYREFDKQMNHLLKQSRKESFHFSVALIDLDGFKTINDKYGYEAGDRAIMECAELIRSNIRVGDQVFRYKNGDEFAVIFPGVLSKGALVAAERIRKNISKHLFQLPDGSIHLTASIGLLSLTRNITEKKEVIQKLESLLQSAKKSGDRIEQG